MVPKYNLLVGGHFCNHLDTDHHLKISQYMLPQFQMKILKRRGRSLHLSSLHMLQKCLKKSALDDELFDLFLSAIQTDMHVLEIICSMIMK